METKEQRDKADCIVVKRPCCGRIVMATVRERTMSADTRKELAALVTEGCTVEHMTAEQVRAADWGCKCHPANNAVTGSEARR